MAMVKCRSCGKEVSQWANKCPHCGSEFPTNLKIYSMIALVIFIISVGVLLGSRITEAEEQRKQQEIEEQEIEQIKEEIDEGIVELQQNLKEIADKERERVLGPAGNEESDDDFYEEMMKAGREYFEEEANEDVE